MSLQMRMVAAYLRRTDKRRGRVPTRPVRPPQAVLRRHEVDVTKVEGFDCHTVSPRGERARSTVVYLHGGRYTRPISPQHWQLVARLADAGVQVHVPLYGLAPKHSYREAYQFVAAVYQQALASAEGGPLAVVGDSSGAGLALGLTQELPGQGLPQPDRLVLIAPWLDLTLTNPAIGTAEAKDPWLRSASLRAAGLAWAGGDDPTQPRLSPINGPLAPLPATDVYVGTRDLLYPDVRHFAQQAADAGTEVNLTVCAGAIHAYPLVPAPEGRAAVRTIISSLTQKESAGDQAR